MKSRIHLSTLLAFSIVLPGSLLLAQAGAPGGEWPTYHGDLGATQYSALDQIDASNFDELEVAWTWTPPDGAVAEGKRALTTFGYKSTPLVVDGRMYINTSLGFVVALDPVTGKEHWAYDTKAYEAGRPTNLGFNSRGVGYWTDGKQERVFHPGNDGYLWAIDAQTGEPVGGFGTNGKVDLIATYRREVPRRLVTFMSSPLVVGNVVVVGSSISDGPTRKEMPPGDVRGYDTRTGNLVWTFHNPPARGEVGYDTWEDGSAEYTGNANVWTNMSADADAGLIYLPFGTPTNDWYGGHRKGDNLFAESIVCIKAATGEYVWHFQLVHHGLWDYDIPAAPTLLDVEIDGKPRKIVAVVSKQGFNYVFDRLTGEPVWPIEERPVPQSRVPGEQTSATQPFPTKPPAFESQGISDDTVIDFTPEMRAAAMETLSHYEYGPIFTPPIVAGSEKNGKKLNGTVQHPGWAGGANWWGAAVDPENGRLYVPSFSSPIVVALDKPDPARSNFNYVRGQPGQEGMPEGHTATRGSIPGPHGLPIIKPPYGRITAYEMSKGEILWQVPHGEGIRQKIIDLGAPDPGPVGSNSGSGPLLTETLLIVGKGAGGRGARSGSGDQSQLFAYDKASGELIATLDIDAPPTGTPMTYMANGRQYIAFAVGGLNAAKLVAVALPASEGETPGAGGP